ncbi:hypothetical protein V1477_005821 [Vespula maculifrons]|uniref:Uncharacterized protein n=3 Tax=Vespula TaxID=7451 RepID=A0A834U3J5_VESGE|nr:hypothetical protein HZH66_003344 [Vespula vulgaris]KAF7415242.1 hypothetical protein HZH68_003731 [Vespula germanica]
MDHRLAYASTNSRSAVNVAALKVVDLRLYAKRRPDIREELLRANQLADCRSSVQRVNVPVTIDPNANTDIRGLECQRKKTGFGIGI